MTCYYCDRIQQNDPAYEPAAAEFDLGSAAPRCRRHWRYLCGQCSQPAHFMACAYCPQAGRFFCRQCGGEWDEVAEAFWGWDYYFRYRSPWSGQWRPGLDRLEYEGRHPMQRAASQAAVGNAVSREPYLIRYPLRPGQWRNDTTPTDEEIRQNWNTNADRWHAGYDEDGDRTRRYQTDEPMLALLGEVAGRRVLDAGSGNGYLCRKLARAGATMTGVDQSDRFIEIARRIEQTDPLGITYHHGSLVKMPFAADESFDAAVSNFVLMDVRDYEAAIAEIHRVIKAGGRLVAVISHPFFTSGPGWYAPAADSPRPEDRDGFLVNSYFDRGPCECVWGNFDPVQGFHRPLRDYWRALTDSGFQIDAFEEPALTDRGRRELPPTGRYKSTRIPYACILRAVKRTRL